MTKKKGKPKRTTTQIVQTRRTSKNEYKWLSRVGYATRMLNRDKYFKIKNAMN